MKTNTNLNWLIDSGLKAAAFWTSMKNNLVKCQLCPRNCVIGNEEVRFCKARYNDNGELKTAIWGKLLQVCCPLITLR